MTENNCEHPAKMKAPWTKSARKGDDSWNIGWACAECGHVKETGNVPGKPHFAKEAPA